MKVNWLPQSRLVKSHLQYRGGLFMKDERHVLMIFPTLMMKPSHQLERLQVILITAFLSLMHA